jgi:hypothetical protein
MTTEDTTGAAGEHEPAADLLREVFDLADDIVDQVTDDDVETQLRRLHAGMARRPELRLGAPEECCPTAPETHTVDTSCRPLVVPALVQSRGIDRAADGAMSVSGSLVASPHDLRVMDRSGREETGLMIAWLRDLLCRCPAGTLDEEMSATILARVATVSEKLVADRDERGALGLINAAVPHLRALDPRHPGAFEVRRAHAEAWSELGHRRRARALLGRLSEDERRAFGWEDPRTTLLLLWALVADGRLDDADDGFRALQAREILWQDVSAPGLWHLQCRYAWLLGRQGRAGESAECYDGVIINRSHVLGEDHPDALDARHSKGKMLVLTGDGPLAVTLLQELHADRARVQGERHSDTLETLKYLHLAHIRAEPEDPRVLDAAIDVLGWILRIQIERHGLAHPMRRDTAAALDRICQLREATRYRETTSLFLP